VPAVRRRDDLLAIAEAGLVHDQLQRRGPAPEVGQRVLEAVDETLIDRVVRLVDLERPHALGELQEQVGHLGCGEIQIRLRGRLYPGGRWYWFRHVLQALSVTVPGPCR